MATAPLEQDPGILASLDRVRVDLASRAGGFVAGMDSMSTRELATAVATVEDISKIVEFLQLAGAWAVERADVARVGERDGLFGGPAAADRLGTESSPSGGLDPARDGDQGESVWADPAEACAQARVRTHLTGRARRRARLGVPAGGRSSARMRSIYGPGWGSVRARQSGGSGWVRLRSPDGCPQVSPGASGCPCLGRLWPRGGLRVGLRR